MITPQQLCCHYIVINCTKWSDRLCIDYDILLPYFLCWMLFHINLPMKVVNPCWETECLIFMHTLVCCVPKYQYQFYLHNLTYQTVGQQLMWWHFKNLSESRIAGECLGSSIVPLWTWTLMLLFSLSVQRLMTVASKLSVWIFHYRKLLQKSAGRNGTNEGKDGSWCTPIRCSSYWSCIPV